MNSTELKTIIVKMNHGFEKNGKSGFTIDGKIGELRLNIEICSVLLGMDRNWFYRTMTRNMKTKRALIQYLRSHQVSESVLSNWVVEGVSLSHFKLLADFCTSFLHYLTKKACEVDRLYQTNNQLKNFEEILYDLIPPEVFALLNKSQQQIIKPTAQSLVKPKRPHLTRLKRYRPAYDAIDKTQKELAIVRHLQKLWGGEREAPTPSAILTFSQPTSS